MSFDSNVLFVCGWLYLANLNILQTSKTTSIALLLLIPVSRIASIHGVVDSYAFLRKAFLLSPFLVFSFIFYSMSIDHSHCWEHFFNEFREQSTSFFRATPTIQNVYCS